MPLSMYYIYRNFMSKTTNELIENNSISSRNLNLTLNLIWRTIQNFQQKYFENVHIITELNVKVFAPTQAIFDIQVF